jgi:hypothetical protein
MINLQITSNPVALGDRIDTIFLAHMISKVENQRVNLLTDMNDLIQLNDLTNFGDVVFNKDQGLYPKYSYNHIKDQKFYLKYSKQFDDIPICKFISNKDISLPEKFVTAQWDAGQLYRLVNRWDPDRITKIENWYKEHGWEVIRIGGEGKYKELDEIYNVMSKAEYHIGADSGMMHIAKFILGPDKMHLYINIRERLNDSRFPDSWNVPWMAREMLRRGAWLNFCENTNPKDKEYFSKVDIWV